ncbi:MAG: non-hydrolyzing UDP-N-acetylglucosamine 2-epimerase, partial [Legionellales bacterium]
MKKKILCIIGTRPEVIKMAPIILALKTQPWVNLRVVATAQHRDLLDQMLKLFGIRPHIDLNIMEPNQKLPQLTAKLINKLTTLFETEKPQAIIGQGDTTSVFCAALAAFYQHIPFYHVEAGLRSRDVSNPFPEEMNRILTDRMSTLLFAPTEGSKINLLSEGIDPGSVHVTGNTVIDALLYISRLKTQPSIKLDPSKRLILLTAHRRESFGLPFLEICKAIRRLANEIEEVQILYPVHPNPQISHIAFQQLGSHKNILLTPPLDYDVFVKVLNQAYLVLTDSGGIQEEAPALGKPVLVLRDKTERPEGIEAGVAKLIGLNAERIFNNTVDLLNNKENYNKMIKNY